jgi:hypothetical protein
VTRSTNARKRHSRSLGPESAGRSPDPLRGPAPDRFNRRFCVCCARLPG